MNYKIPLLFIICWFVSWPLFADRYKVLFANSKNITINGKKIKKGMRFDDKQAIGWSSENQAIKVLNLNDNRVYLIPAKDYNAKQSKSLWEYILTGFQRISHLSTYGMEIKSEYDGRRFMIDTIHVAIKDLAMREVQYSVITYNGGNQITIPLKRTKDGKFLIISRKDFDKKNSCLVSLDIIEKDCQDLQEVYLYRNLIVEILPLKVY